MFFGVHTSAYTNITNVTFVIKVLFRLLFIRLTPILAGSSMTVNL